MPISMPPRGRDMTGMMQRGWPCRFTGGVDAIPNPNNGRFTFTFNVTR